MTLAHRIADGIHSTVANTPLLLTDIMRYNELSVIHNIELFLRNVCCYVIPVAIYISQRKSLVRSAYYHGQFTKTFVSGLLNCVQRFVYLWLFISIFDNGFSVKNTNLVGGRI